MNINPIRIRKYYSALNSRSNGILLWKYIHKTMRRYRSYASIRLITLPKYDPNNNEDQNSSQATTA